MKVLEKNIDKNTINMILNILLDTERKVIKLKHGFYGQEMSFYEIGDHFGITRQCACQYYWQGINRIKKILRISS